MLCPFGDESLGQLYPDRLGIASTRKHLDKEPLGRANVSHIQAHKEKKMDKDRIEGAANQAKGAVKDATGKIIGDTKLQAEGKADKLKGKVQNAVGGAKDAMRDAQKH
jgi:uncharacterized protein YjbJ (UPF0337 family)